MRRRAENRTMGRNTRLCDTRAATRPRKPCQRRPTAKSSNSASFALAPLKLPDWLPHSRGRHARGDEQPPRGRVLDPKNQGRPAAAPGEGQRAHQLAAPRAISRSSRGAPAGRATRCSRRRHGLRGRGRDGQGEFSEDAAEAESRGGRDPRVAALPEGLARQAGGRRRAGDLGSRKIEERGEEEGYIASHALMVTPPEGTRSPGPIGVT